MPTKLPPAGPPAGTPRGAPEERPTTAPSEQPVAGDSSIDLLSTRASSWPGTGLEVVAPVRGPSDRPPLVFEGVPYQLQKRIGTGASGNVYLFENSSGGRVVGKWCRDEKMRSHQARVLWRASSAVHPNVARGLGEVLYCGRKLLLMEHVPGGPLRSMMSTLVKTPTLRFSEKTDACRYLVYQTLKGLAHLHQQGIIHRDIKPENILWDSVSLEPKIADFGISVHASPDGQVLEGGDIPGSPGGEGTPHYMPPEAVSTGQGGPTPKGDIWAMGAVLYEMVRGESRFEAPNIFALLYQVHKFGASSANRVRQVRIVEESEEGRRVRYVDEPTAFGRLVNKMMHPQPEQRPTVLELLGDPFFEDMTDDEVLGGVERTLRKVNDVSGMASHQLQQ